MIIANNRTIVQKAIKKTVKSRTKRRVGQDTNKVGMRAISKKCCSPKWKVLFRIFRVCRQATHTYPQITLA